MPLTRTSAVRRSPIVLVMNPSRSENELREVAEGLIVALARRPELDLTVWSFARATSVRQVLVPRPRVGPYGPDSIRWVQWVAWSLRPSFLATSLATRLIAGPTAARPQAILGIGLDDGGYVATALARVLDVPAAIALPSDDLEDGHWTRARLAAARRAELLLTTAPRLADQLARRGFETSLHEAASEVGAWEHLGEGLRLIRD